LSNIGPANRLPGGLKESRRERTNAMMSISRRCFPSIFFVFGWMLIAADLHAANPTQTENAKPGSPDWQLTDPATNHEIEGYASLTSVNRGGQIDFFVNTADPTFTLEFFRMGWYGAAGARRMMAPLQLAGISQPMPTPNPTTGIVACQWTVSYTLSVPNDADPTNWASGVYLARLTGNTSGKQSFIIFVVRDDTRPSTHFVPAEREHVPGL
jgi:hypothetical protein